MATRNFVPRADLEGSIGTATKRWVAGNFNELYISTTMSDGVNSFTIASLVPASGIVAGDITNWDTAYGWGDHSLAGYLTDAPSDGNNYGRNNGAWAIISAGATDHTALTTIGINTHAQIDTHIGDATIHFTEASINITESQISDLQSYLLPADIGVTVQGYNANTTVQGVITLGSLGGTTDHTALSNIGVNSHATIDSHISDTTIHYTQASITTVGTITTGTWNGTIVDEVYGGTGTGTYVTGDMLYSDATNSLAKLGIGTAYQHLKTNAGATAPEWVTEEGTVNIMTSDWITAGGNIVHALVFVGDEVARSMAGSGGAGGTPEIGFLVGDFIVPEDYKSGGTLDIWVRRDGAVVSHTMNAWINNTIDSTISVLSIIATADVTWEKKTLTFGSTIAAGDVINLEITAETPTADIIAYNKAGGFNYNR